MIYEDDLLRNVLAMRNLWCISESFQTVILRFNCFTQKHFVKPKNIVLLQWGKSCTTSSC